MPNAANNSRRPVGFVHSCDRMKRHAAFQNLSRDHFTGLLACLHIERAAEGQQGAKETEEAVNTMYELWHHDLRHHFDEEDANLVPILKAKGATEIIARLHSDHTEIRATMENLDETNELADWVAMSENLRKHIRWEEGVLFPWLQEHLEDAELEGMLAASVEYRTATRGPNSVQQPSF